MDKNSKQGRRSISSNQIKARVNRPLGKGNSHEEHNEQFVRAPGRN
jgi:hypothetical protein